MTGKEYLQMVVDRIATYGNRDNDNFITAFTIAQGFLDDYSWPGFHGTARLDYNDLLRVDRQIRQGLEHFTEGAKYFDFKTRVAFETLTCYFNNNEAKWKGGAV